MVFTGTVRQQRSRALLLVQIGIHPKQSLQSSAPLMRRSKRKASAIQSSKDQGPSRSLQLSPEIIVRLSPSLWGYLYSGVLSDYRRIGDLQVSVAAVMGLGVANRVLYKMALSPLSDYVFFLAQFQTFSYVLVYFAVLAFRRYW